VGVRRAGAGGREGARPWAWASGRVCCAGAVGPVQRRGGSGVAPVQRWAEWDVWGGRACGEGTPIVFSIIFFYSTQALFIVIIKYKR